LEIVLDHAPPSMAPHGVSTTFREARGTPIALLETVAEFMGFGGAVAQIPAQQAGSGHELLPKAAGTAAQSQGADVGSFADRRRDHGRTLRGPGVRAGSEVHPR